MSLALASHPEVDGWDVDVIAEALRKHDTFSVCVCVCAWAKENTHTHNE